MYRLSFYHAQTNKIQFLNIYEKQEILFTWEKSNFRSLHAQKKKETKKERKYANFQQIKITNNAIT